MAKLVLIEDDQTMRMLLTTLLELEGYQVAAWMSGDDPLDFVTREKPDAILMDVNLRSVNGFDILAAIRKDETLAGCKVIMSSGFDYREKSLALGADEFIMKPYMPDHLMQRIKRLLESFPAK